MEQMNPLQPSQPQMMTYQLTYPEIYYKLQPYISMVCDQINPLEMPTQEMLDRISDNIYDDVCKRYPDLESYVNNNKVNTDTVVPTIMFGNPGMFGWGFRRRGVFRDVIDILLLSELFNRRRRYYY